VTQLIVVHSFGAGGRRFELGRGRVVHLCTPEPMRVDGKGVAASPTVDIRLEAGARIARLWV
jgi:hypothetical protein